jgi:hydrogenase nickel insertion protein HypA
MTQLVEELLEHLSGHKVIKVDEVVVEVGDLMFLGDEQMRFAWNILAEDNNLLKGSKLTLVRIPAEVRCKKCGYEGGLELADDPSFHNLVTKFACPKCEGDIEIVRGRECIIKNVSAEVED